MQKKKVLTIAGSDSGGGAGIQGDIKTISSLGCYAMSAITAVTSQNTKEVKNIIEIPDNIVSDQIDLVLSDIGADCIKIGMIFSAKIIDAVCLMLEKYSSITVITDPVMVSKSGTKLLKPEDTEHLKNFLLPKSHLITPNITEAEILSGMKINSESDMISAGKEILNYGSDYVLIKGGHSKQSNNNILLSKDNLEIIPFERIESKNTHGTGCTLSSAIASYIAIGYNLPESIKKAADYVSKAMKNSYKTGEGHGSLNHFWQH